MSMRISSLIAAAAILSGCGNVSEEPEGPDVTCAVGPGAEFADVCTLEVIAADEFVIHHPDGGFRRFVWADNGTLTASDGAEPLVSGEGGESILEFSLESDRYRVPADIVPPPGNE